MLNMLLRLHVWSSNLLAVRPCEIDAARPAATVDRHAPIDVHGRSSVDRGQATTEYALVMLGAAVVALLVVSWATAGGGAGKIGRLFDRVIDAVVSRV